MVHPPEITLELSAAPATGFVLSLAREPSGMPTAGRACRLHAPGSGASKTASPPALAEPVAADRDGASWPWRPSSSASMRSNFLKGRGFKLLES